MRILSIFASLLFLAGTTAKGETLKIGMDPTYFPMAYVKDGATSRDDLAGYDVEYAQALAKKLDRSIQIVRMDYDKILDAVADGEVDLGISALEIVPNKSAIRFIEYYAMPEALVATTGKGMKPEAEPDLSTRTVGTVKVSAARTVFHLKMNRGDVKQVKAFDSERLLFAALEAEQVDAVVVHLPTAKRRVDLSEGKLQLLAPDVARQPVGIAVARTAKDLGDQVLEAVIALKKDGTAARIGNEVFAPLTGPTLAEAH